jgi:hypothetical protein
VVTPARCVAIAKVVSSEKCLKPATETVLASKVQLPASSAAAPCELLELSVRQLENFENLLSAVIN